MSDMQRQRRVRYCTYPSPSLEQDEDDNYVELVTCRRISFPVDVQFQSAVQQQDNVEVDKILTQHGSTLDLNTRNHLGLTALHHAVINHNLDTVKLLLGRGADANVPDAQGFSPLHTASADGLRNIASLLVIFGGDLSARTLAGESAVDLAKDVATADLLLVETCRQIQQHELMEKYGFAFRFIDLCERLSANGRAIYRRIVEWTRCTLENLLGNDRPSILRLAEKRPINGIQNKPWPQNADR